MVPYDSFLFLTFGLADSVGTSCPGCEISVSEVSADTGIQYEMTGIL